MKPIKYILTALLISFFSSCGNTENNKLIIGKWTGSEWLIDGNPSNRNTAETHFIFNEQGNYSFIYEGSEEKGTYKIENDMLFTKQTNQQEIMVKINKLTKDSLIFNMNRSGTSEILTLLKNK